MPDMSRLTTTVTTVTSSRRPLQPELLAILPAQGFRLLLAVWGHGTESVNITTPLLRPRTTARTLAAI